MNKLIIAFLLCVNIFAAEYTVNNDQVLNSSGVLVGNSLHDAIDIIGAAKGVLKLSGLITLKQSDTIPSNINVLWLGGYAPGIIDCKTFNLTVNGYFINDPDYPIFKCDSSNIPTLNQPHVKSIWFNGLIGSAYDLLDSCNIVGNGTYALKNPFIMDTTFTLKKTFFIDSTNNTGPGEYMLWYDPATEKVTVSEIPHGYLSFQDSVDTITISVQDDWYDVTNDSVSLFTWVEYVCILDGSDTITLHDTGHYEIHFAVDGEGSNTQTYQLGIYNITQGEFVSGTTSETMRGQSNTATLGTVAYCTNCNGGDKLIMKIRNRAGTGDFIVNNGFIFIRMTHKE